MFARHASTIEKPQLWPHNHLDPHFVTHMPKFQDISWDQLVVGEVAIIFQAKYHTQATGRLHLLKQLAYWKLCLGNLYEVQQLYMAVVRAIEEGETSWSSNFQLLEVLVMGDQPKTAHKSSKPIFEDHTESKEGKKVLFCKEYQSDECHTDLKNNAHWGTLGEKSHLLYHVWATCLLKHKKS